MDTPLHDAAENGHVDVVEVLVGRGGDVNMVNMSGVRVVDVMAVAGLSQEKGDGDDKGEKGVSHDKDAADVSRDTTVDVSRDDKVDSGVLQDKVGHDKGDTGLSRDKTGVSHDKVATGMSQDKTVMSRDKTEHQVDHVDHDKGDHSATLRSPSKEPATTLPHSNSPATTLPHSDQPIKKRKTTSTPTTPRLSGYRRFEEGHVPPSPPLIASPAVTTWPQQHADVTLGGTWPPLLAAKSYRVPPLLAIKLQRVYTVVAGMKKKEK